MHPVMRVRLPKFIWLILVLRVVDFSSVPNEVYDLQIKIEYLFPQGY